MKMVVPSWLLFRLRVDFLFFGGSTYTDPTLLSSASQIGFKIGLPPPARGRAQSARTSCGSARFAGRGYRLVLGLLLGVQVLLEQDAELLAQGLELSEVLLVLLLVLDLGLDACCDQMGSANRQFL